ITPDCYRITLASSYIASHAKPGQFVNVKCSDACDPLLRRPLSIHQISAPHKTFTLLYRVVGKATRLLAQYSVGAELDILGPLGNGFNMSEEKNIHVLVGGGLGIAPLRALADQLKGDKSKKNAVYLLSGHSTKSCVVCEQELLAAASQLLFSTDDGTYGKKGFVSDLLLDLLENTIQTSNIANTTIYACGPHPMLHAIADIAYQKQIDCQVSMEAYMACGIGTCLGCVIETRGGYKKVCDEGPVFDAKEIIWKK
ncbi:MAG: dihydroorotate dehydrogenase electron transfer subunit, partial [Candidatus Margulisiibacteriota bacterium]